MFCPIVCARESSVVGVHDCSINPPCIHPVTRKRLPRVDIQNERTGDDFFYCQCARLVKEKPSQNGENYFRNYYNSRPSYWL
ncbi:hypothetical protein DdX_15359 [Ditylenchus destructor]|uniref:Uncharacterized protein n=1 Tax=Ditylenchus destructor TaxID=166010 RepID=A0AAD4MVH6_9BILA|nr:hypothetical protein DdX_15359 [Ditylenchus destructor]